MGIPTRLLRGIVAPAIIVLGSTIGAANAQEVGAVAGEFSVTPDGQAAYVIPVQVPPGVLGVEPRLSIGYRSGGDNGLLGRGGRLSGFSTITRCAANLAEDGFAAGVHHATTDRFCLDGQKLVAVSGGYGDDGTEYRTVIETFQRVVSRGSVAYPGGGSGPESFIVYLRNGGVLEFGQSDNARIRHPGTGVVHQWLISRLVDVNGNALDYAYQDFGSAGAVEKHPLRIDYGANANAGQEHHMSVQFGYEVRADTSSGFVAGIKFQRSRRLSFMSTEVDGSTVKIYSFGYDSAPTSGESRLVSVSECAADAVTCYAPTTFDWTSPDTGWSAGPVLPPDHLVDGDGHPRGMAVDLDGDGRTDWLTAYRDGGGDHLGAWLSDGDGFSYDAAYVPPEVLVDYTTGGDGAVLSELVDVNGDGLPDWVTAYRNAGDVLVRDITLNDGTGFNVDAPCDLPIELTDLTAGTNGMRKARLVDVDGDARVDVLVSTRDDTGVWQQGAWVNTGGGWIADGSFLPPVIGLDYAASADGIGLADLVDLNGDQLPDWVQAVQTDDGTDHHGIWLNTGSGWSPDAGYVLPVVLTTYVGDAEGISRAELVDVNGDDLPDVVQAHRRGDGTEDRHVWLNTGSAWQSDAGLAPPVVLAERTSAGHELHYGTFMDVNGDGLPDLVQSYLNTSGVLQVAAWRQTASGWTPDNDLALPLPLHALRTGDDSIAIGGLVDMNHDGAMDLILSAEGYAPEAWLNSVGPNGVAGVLAVERITTGFGVETRIEYASSANSDVYAPAMVSGYGSYPNLPLPGPFILVGAVEASNGIGGFDRTEHVFGDFRANAVGRGSLGFAWHTITDVATDTVMRSQFSQEFPFAGQMVETTKSIGGSLVSETYQTAAHKSLNGGLTDYPYVAGKTTTVYELNGSEISTHSVITAIDDFGNATEVATQTADATGTYVETVTNTWQNDTTNWVLGKRTQTVLENAAPNVPSITRTTEYTVNAKGQTIQKVAEPGHAQALTTTYTYDVYGNVTSTTTSAAGTTDRTGTVAYTTDGRFPSEATNALGHVLRKEFDERFGEVVRSEDPNGSVTERQYDVLGRQVLETRIHVNDVQQDQSGSDAVVYEWCGAQSNCPDNALYFVGTQGNEDEPGESVYYDRVGREVRKQSLGFDGAPIYQDTEYDARGNKARVSRPYFAGDPPKWTSYTYDPLDRAIEVVRPDGARTTTVYAGRTRTVTNALGQTTSTTLNAAGSPVEEVDAAGGVTRHTYDAAGRLIETVDPLGNRITADFDIFGRKVAMSDPDMGDWTYQYDAFGQLVSQTDANGQTVTMSYDALGRMVQRVELEGTTTWSYDTAQNGIGKLAEVTQAGYSRSHEYDDRGRLARETVTIDGQTFETAYHYVRTTDRLDRVVYPNGWTIRKEYTEFGYPQFVRSVNPELAAEVDAQWQESIDLAQAAQTLESDLQPARDDHYDQMNYYKGLADPLAAQAKSLANEANRKVEQYNDAARKSRQHAQSYQDHLAAANEIKRQIAWRKEVRENHIAAAAAADNDGNVPAYNFHIEWANKYADEINALAPQHDQKVHVAEGQAYAANEWAAKANQYAAEAESLQAQAEDKIDDANGYYATANTHAEAINDIDRQVQAAVDAANNAHEIYESLAERLTEEGTTHWEATGTAADGQVTQFKQGNGIVTDLEYYGDTGRVARIRAMGDPALAEPLGIEEITRYLDMLGDLVADFNAQILEFQTLADAAVNEKAIAETEAQSERDKAQGHRDLGESALAILADARAVQLDVEVAIQHTRILLNEGLVGIHQDSIATALSLIDEFEDATGAPGEGRALQVAYHELLKAHYGAIEDLYLGLSSTYAGLEAEAAELEADPPLDAPGFQALAEDSSALATYNEVRAAAYDTAMLGALEGGESPVPLSQLNLSLSAALMEQRGRLYDHHGDLVDALFRRGRDLAAVLSAYHDERGLPGAAAYYQGNTTAGLDKADFLRRMARAYKERGGALHATLQAEQAASGEGDAFDNQFAELAALFTTQAATYEEMQSALYWQEFYLGLANRLSDATSLYTEQAAGNAALAARHAGEAANARNANDHRLLVGVDGAVQDEQYFFDAVGNLTSRADHAVDLEEQFGYDSLNRLTDSTLSGEGAALYAFAGIETTTYAYDAIGNLIERSDSGSYTYGGSGGAGVHAVSAISGLVNAAYAYDANGNQLSGNGRSVAWSSFNKPVQISAGGSTVTLAYGPERQLVKQTRPDGGGGTRTTYYVGALYEKSVTTGGETTSRYHVTAAGKTVAVINDTSAGVPETHYLHRDHLDSIVATSNEAGQVIERFHYDPFGKRRMAVIDDDPLGTTLDLARSDRGYTGHRHLESVNLIHMNGRVYDPGIGRFLSADPHVQFAGYSQSYNRYSYLMNNPLNATDPSGYFFSKVFKRVKRLFKKVLKVVKKAVKTVVRFVKENIRTIAAVAIAVVAPMALAAIAPTLGSIAVGAIAGGLSGLVATGSLKGALLGAATGAALAGIGNAFGQTNGMAFRSGWVRTGMTKSGEIVVKGLTTAGRVAKSVAHGLAGGLRGMLSGGSFSKSFMSMGFTQAVSPGIDRLGGTGLGGSAARIAAGGVVGGTAAVLGGGSFREGFESGVLSRALNDELHIGFTGKLAGWIKSGYELITGLRLPVDGGSAGLMLATPSIGYSREEGLFLEGELDFGVYTTEALDTPISGPTRPVKESAVTFGLEFGASGGSIIMDGRDNYDFHASGQLGRHGGSLTVSDDYRSWGVEYRFGTGHNVEVGASRTRAYSFFSN